MKFFKTFDIAASGMKVEQKRMDVVSNNIANAHTTKTADGTPYRRQDVAVSSQDASAFESAYSQASMDGEFSNIFEETGVGYSGRGAQVDGVVEDAVSYTHLTLPTTPYV